MIQIGGPRSRYMAVIMTAAVGTLATFAAFVLMLFWQYRIAEIDFHSKAERYLEVINADLGDADTLLYTIAAFMSADDHPVSAQEFAHFSTALHRRVPGLRDTAWAPQVTLAERPSFERDARAAGIAGYAIKQFGPHHTLIPAAARAQYYPLLFIEAGGAKRPLLGFDLISEQLRARAALRALQTGQPAATRPMDVVTVKQRGAGVLSYMSVHGSRREPGSRRSSANGIVLGVFDIPAMIQSILAKNTTAGDLRLYLFNPAADSGRRVLYQSAASGSGQPLSERELLAGAHWQSTVVVIDQPIGAIVTPAQPLRLVHWSLAGITTLAVGLTMTTMLVAYLLLSLRRSVQLEVLTSNLQASAVTLHENAAQIVAMSRHDALTGMPNRALFGKRVDEALARFGRAAPFSLLFLDLDRFKIINDTLGHGAGDQLLCEVAVRIKAGIRETDTAARIGGDEFAIILPDTADRATISMIAGQLIERLGQPYSIEDQSMVISVSIGAAISSRGVTAKALIAEADLAMYEAKNSGGGTLRIFEERLRTRVVEKHLIENELRRALESDELEVHYQPLMDLAHNEVSCFEALIRWNHPERGMIAPDRFIPVAEDCGLIVALGAFVLRTACEDAARWPRPVRVAVNVSPLQFRDSALSTTILECLRASGLPPGRLEIEITEATVLHDGGTVLAVLKQLRALGVTVAFDDFGTGYSSLSSLLRFPFDKIKIDQSFVKHMQTSPNSAAIVRAVVGLGSNLNLVTTGEGVETFAQLERLRAFGCSEAQGFLFSPALPNAEVPRLLRELDAKTASALAAMRV